MKTELGGAAVAQLRSVGKSYDNGTLALEDIDLDILEGEFLCLLGPSGCGKSTILRLLAGLSNPSSGVLHRSTPTGADLGYVFQDPTLMPWATVTDNVALPLQLWHKPKAEVAAEVARVLDTVGLANFANAYPRELSGGMKMRVSIARALVTRPKLLLMDEPFAALDEITRGRLDDDLLAIRKKSGCTIVFVTHSTAESVYLATRIAVMRSRPGRIVGYIDVPYESRGAPYRVSQDFAKTAAEVTEILGRGEAA